MILKSMIITPNIILYFLVGMIIILLWVKIIQFHFIPPKCENHNHGMILKGMIFILKRDEYYPFVFVVYLIVKYE